MLWTAAIIAGGAASRLEHRDKSSLLVGGRSILDRQLSAIRPLTDRILVVANHPDRFAAAGLEAVEDRVPGAGALGGIYTALLCATTERVIAVACDMPFVTTAFLAQLARLGAGADLVIPRPGDGYQPLCACYARGCIEPIRRRIAERALRVQDLVCEVLTHEVGREELAAFDPDHTLFFNVNTPEDHARAQQLALAHETHQQS